MKTYKNLYPQIASFENLSRKTTSAKPSRRLMAGGLVGLIAIVIAVVVALLLGGGGDEGDQQNQSGGEGRTEVAQNLTDTPTSTPTRTSRPTATIAASPTKAESPTEIATEAAPTEVPTDEVTGGPELGIDARSACSEDGLKFTITNTGGDMSNSVGYSVFSVDLNRDLEIGQFQLAAGGSIDLDVGYPTGEVILRIPYLEIEISDYCFEGSTTEVPTEVPTEEPEPDIDATGACKEDGSGVYFTITNNGGGMSSPVSYSVFSVDLNHNLGSSQFQLPAGGTIPLYYPYITGIVILRIPDLPIEVSSEICIKPKEEPTEMVFAEPIERTFEDGVTMVLVPAGCFDMGSTTGDSDESPVTQICFDAPFWIDKYEVTQGDFARLGGVAANENGFSGERRPRETITWYEARNFCERKRGGRLPTEAEWEYAARGPDGLIYPWGDYFEAANVVYGFNSDSQTAEVGSKTGGVSWVGAYDLSGNVWEWVSSLYLPYDSDDDREDDSNNSNLRVLRGGSFASLPFFLRTAYRGRNYPNDVSYFLGFRCVRSIN